MADTTPPALPSPGTYLRLRREADGLSLREVAFLYAHHISGVAVAEQLLGAAERDAGLLTQATLDRLRTVFAFDSQTYFLLFDKLPVPSICRSCGCTWSDPCIDPAHGPCAWADVAETVCTRCERRAIAA